MPGSPSHIAHEVALSFDRISFSYSKAPFIEGLCCDIETSCITGIVGPNGCGKSTLLRLACGLLAPSQGSVSVGGEDLRHLSASQRARRVALMPQGVPSVYMSVRELVLSGRYAHQGFLQLSDADDYRIADESLDAVGMRALAARSVHALSGGQRQRAYIAMMLAQQAPCMLLDEPTSALDIHAAHEVLRLVQSLRQDRDAAIVLVMHDLDLALRYCDKLIVMNEGAFVTQGSVEEVASSGVLEEVFQIEIHRHHTPSGNSWSFFPA